MAAAACVPRAAPPPAPAPAPAPAPVQQPVAPPLAADWQDWPRTPGSWRYQRDPGGSRAIFGDTAQPERALLRCDASARSMVIELPGATATAWTIRTSATTRRVAVRAGDGATPRTIATFAPTDRLLDAMVFSRGRFAIERAGQPPLVLPPWSEVGRVIEDCRS